MPQSRSDEDLRAVPSVSTGGQRIHAGTDTSFRDGTRKRIRSEEADVVIVKSGNMFYAFDNNCPHQHFAALHDGLFEKHSLTCPMHGWCFDIRTGISRTGEGRLSMRKVTVEGDDVWILPE